MTMLKKIIIILYLFFVCLSINAKSLQGVVTYNETSARIEAFKDLEQYCPFDKNHAFNNDNILSIQEYETKVLKIIPVKFVGVVYKDNQNITYYYVKNKDDYKCIVIEALSKDSKPIKTVSYNAQTGKMISVSLLVSDNERFVYDINGKLLAHITDSENFSIKDKQNLLREIIHSSK